MLRMIIGFDPSKAQLAIGELRRGIAPDVDWRVLNLEQNPNGVEPARTTAAEEDTSVNLLERVIGWFGKDSEEQVEGDQPSTEEEPHALAGRGSILNLSEEELEYLRHAPARVGTVIVISAPDSQATAVRQWSLRHSGFSLAPQTDIAANS